MPGVVSIVQWCILGLGAGTGVCSVLVLLVALWERFGERKLALQCTIALFGGCLGVAQLIPLLHVWGLSSVQSSGDVYALCRIYLTVCFSLLPMVHWTVVCLLLQSLYKYRIQCDESLRASRNHTRSHLVYLFPKLSCSVCPVSPAWLSCHGLISLFLPIVHQW